MLTEIYIILIIGVQVSLLISITLLFKEFIVYITLQEY